MKFLSLTKQLTVTNVLMLDLGLPYNEVIVAGLYNPKTVVSVLNNGIFGIEVVLSEARQAYDNAAPAEYHRFCNPWVLKVGLLGV